jgi:hypothetical protein
MAPLGGVERPGRVVRFARLIHRPVRVLGGPAVRAASGGNLKRLIATQSDVQAKATRRQDSSFSRQGLP